MSSSARYRKNRRGSAFVEFTLLFPILFFMLLGAFDMGFVCYALIATQNAARVAALYTSLPGNQSDATTACLYVRAELQMMPNYSQLPAACNALPLRVTVLSGNGPDGMPASTVTVSYKTVQLIPIPAVPAQLTISRTVEMRVRT
jgi:Flp pilus assembly protein TadG